MADKSNQLVLDALHRAVGDPAGIPLYTSKRSPGLFAATAAAKKAAQLCMDQGYVRTLRTETKGKSICDICAITEKGLAHLLSELTPKQVLESLVGALEARRAQVTELVDSARRTQADFEALRATVEKVLQQVRQPAAAPASDKQLGDGNGFEVDLAAIVGELGRWQSCGVLEDCPLPQLFRGSRQAAATITIGQFHDALRRLHERMQIYLHPWTGPMSEIPEPAFALMVGHEIAYYASLRQ